MSPMDGRNRSKTMTTNTNTACFYLTAHPSDRRAAKGLLQRALRPFGAKPYRYDAGAGYGMVTNFSFEATPEQFDAALAEVRRLARAEGWDRMPCDPYYLSGH